MVETISPVVHGGRARWRETLVLHALGATATAAAFGATLGWLGGTLGAPWRRSGLLAVAAVAMVYALGELTPLRVPIPQLRRQVPDWWRTFFGRRVASALYGAGLGVGFLTYLAHGTLVVVAFAAIASGRPTIGALLLVPFGLVRGLSPVVGRRSVTPGAASVAGGSSGLVARVASSGRERCGACGACRDRARGRDRGAERRRGPVGIRGAASTFAWGALSKIVARRRWRRALAAHVLPAIVGTRRGMVRTPGGARCSDAGPGWTPPRGGGMVGAAPRGVFARARAGPPAGR